MPRQLVYYSGTGVSRRIAQRFGGIELGNYSGGEYILLAPSYGAPRTRNFVPQQIKRFLAENADQMVGVVGVGNTTFGPEFCLGAIRISQKFQVPVITLIDVSATPDQLNAIRRALHDG